MQPDHSKKLATTSSPRSREPNLQDRRVVIAQSAYIDPDQTDLILWDFDGTVVNTEPYHEKSFFAATEKLLGIKIEGKAYEVLSKIALGHGEISSTTTIVEYAFENWREMGIDKEHLLNLQALPELAVLIEKNISVEKQLQKMQDLNMSADQRRQILKMERSNPTVLRLANYILDDRPAAFAAALIADRSATLRDGVLEALQTARINRMRNGLVTGSSAPIVESTLDIFHLQSLFDPKIRYYSPTVRPYLRSDSQYETYEIEDCKPEKGCYIKARDKAEVSAERTVILENSATGVLSGVRSGSKVIASPDGDFFKHESPVENVKDLADQCKARLDKAGISEGEGLVIVIPSLKHLHFSS